MLQPLATLDAFSPVTPVTPFTYRDTATNMTILSTLEDKLNEVIDGINAVSLQDTDNLNAAILALTNELNATLATALNTINADTASLEALQASMATLQTTLNSDQTSITNALADITALHTSVAGEIAQNTSDIAALTEYDLRKHGVVADGVTNDRPAFQAVLDTARLAGGGVVIVPIGTVLIDSYLRVGSNTIVHGKGPGSVIKLIDNAPNTPSSDLIHNYSLNEGFPAALATPAAPVVTYEAGGGSLAAGTYSYRVSALNDVGETLASAAATGTAPVGSARMQVSWSAVPGATKYNVFGRVAGSERLIAENVAILGFMDDGTVTPTSLTSDYDYSSTRATTQDTNIRLADLTLDGNVANNGGINASAGAVYFNNVDGLTVSNVVVRNVLRHGISCEWVTNGVLTGNIIHDVGYAQGFTALMFYMHNSQISVTDNVITHCGFGILTDHYTNNITISGNTITACSDSGIGADEGSSDITIVGNTSTGHTNYGITITDGQTARNTKNIVVANNNCVGNGDTGIVFAGIENFVCVGNVCTKNGNGVGSGIRTATGTALISHDGIISDNNINQNGQGMALQTGCTNIDVVNNKISRNAAHGIELTSTKHCTVRQNTIANNNSNNIAGFLCGLKLSGSNVDAVIIGNVVNNDVATYGQHAGIYISGALNNGTRYGGNVVYNNQDNQLFSETAAPQADVVLTY